MGKLKTQNPIVFNGINTQITQSKILVQLYTSQVL
jgi:hypothetical protein